MDWVDVSFFGDGILTWSEYGAGELEGTGTWECDGAHTIVVRFDAAVPSLGTDQLSLEVDEFERACGEVDGLWDALTSAQPALRFEPVGC